MYEVRSLHHLFTRIGVGAASQSVVVVVVRMFWICCGGTHAFCSCMCKTAVLGLEICLYPTVLGRGWGMDDSEMLALPHPTVWNVELLKTFSLNTSAAVWGLVFFVRSLSRAASQASI